MIIVGGKGFAKEVLEVLHKNDDINNLVFYDDINTDNTKLFDCFPVLQSLSEAKQYFDNIDNRYCIGLGNPILRFEMHQKFAAIGGIFTSVISRNTDIGSYDVTISAGCNVLSGVKLSNSVIIGMGCILYYNCIITHDVSIGDFVEISPGATLLGRCKVESFSRIGSGAIILPDVVIGRNVTIGAGAIVNKDIPDNCVAVGIPAKVTKQLNPISR
jgi:sugar O-acyltransferase (sialic acid O-acetyltransferase NeuD family)